MIFAGYQLLLGEDTFNMMFLLPVRARIVNRAAAPTSDNVRPNASRAPLVQSLGLDDDVGGVEASRVVTKVRHLSFMH